MQVCDLKFSTIEIRKKSMPLKPILVGLSILGEVSKNLYICDLLGPL